jgi:serine protease inhibitor
MPNMKYDGSYDLNDILKNLGLELGFDPGKADFSAMGSARARQHLYRQGQAEHRVHSSARRAPSPPPRPSVEMTLAPCTLDQDQCELRLDRPFVYALNGHWRQDEAAVFHGGVLDNPAA